MITHKNHIAATARLSAISNNQKLAARLPSLTNHYLDGQWRHYVNQQLTQHYPALFEQLHTLVMLEIPGFGKVMEWRSLQEKTTSTKRRHASPDE